MALIKLRNYTAANAELLKLGDLDAVHLSKFADDGEPSVSYAVPVLMRTQFCVVTQVPFDKKVTDLLHFTCELHVVAAACCDCNPDPDS